MVLEWTEEFPGTITKPVRVCLAGFVLKLVELAMVVLYWGFGKKQLITHCCSWEPLPSP